MVQVFQTGNPQGKIAEMLGMSLGQGLGNGINTYYANKALDDVLNDPSLSNQPISAKMGKLQSALSPYGETGQNLFNQRMQIEQQAAQEEQAKVEAKEAKEKETRLFKQQKELQEQKDLAAAARVNTQQVGANTRAGSKGPIGGLSGQPIPKEQSDLIDKVLTENPNATPDQLRLKMDKAGILPGYSGPYIQNRRDEQTNKTTAAATVTSNDIKLHQESKDYEDTLIKDVRSAKKNLESIEDIEKVVDKIKPFFIANILKGTGTIGDKIARANLTKEQAKLLSLIPDLLEGKKEIFGVRLSDADLRVVQDKIADIGNSPEANKELLRIAKKYAKRSILKNEAAENVLEKHGVPSRSGKLRPLNYARLIEKEHENLIAEEENGVMMQLPDGRQVPIDRSKVKEAESLGATRIKR